MKQLFQVLGFAMLSVYASATLAWSPFAIIEFSTERQQHCLFTVADACPEGATCNEYGEVICGPGEVCQEEEPDCE